MTKTSNKLKFHYYCADLIDRFNYANTDKKLNITKSFPFKDEYVTGNTIRAAYIAGVVEELCRRDKWVPVPILVYQV